MLGRVLDATFRNFSTLFLLAALWLLPLHLTYGYLFRNALTVRELHPAIEQFPEDRQVKSVGRTQLDQARGAFWGLTILELLLLPLFAKAARDVLDRDRRGDLPTISAALAALSKRAPDRQGFGTQGVGPVAVAFLAAVGVALLLEEALTLAVAPLPDATEFAGIALAQASARGFGAPFVAVAIVLARRTKAPEPEELDLY